MAGSPINLMSVLTCPNCGQCETLAMPEDRHQWVHLCLSCSNVLLPRQGDCCA